MNPGNGRPSAVSLPSCRDPIPSWLSRGHPSPISQGKQTSGARQWDFISQQSTSRLFDTSNLWLFSPFINALHLPHSALSTSLAVEVHSHPARLAPQQRWPSQHVYNMAVKDTSRPGSDPKTLRIAIIGAGE